ncbi:hypothetical protein V8F06_009017 [Rhypophila decipiens]
MWRSLTNMIRGDDSVPRHRNILIPPRHRQAAPDTTRLSLLDLSADILHQILTLIQGDDQESILHLALVCSSLYHQARYVQFREFTLHLAEDASNGHSQLDYLQTHRPLLPAIRTLYIVGTHSFRKKPRAPMTKSQRSRLDPDGLIGHLTPLLPIMTGLSDIYWHEGQEKTVLIPDDLVTALGTRPHIRLHVSTQSAPNVPEPRDVLNRHAAEYRTMVTLRGSPNLVSLSVEYTYSADVDKDAAQAFTEATRRLILSCPNLRNLSVDIFPFLPSPFYTGFGFSDSDNSQVAPSLETLTILNYPWGTDRRIPHQQPNLDWYDWISDIGILNSVRYPDGVNCPEPEYWATGPTFDWSRITKLHERKPAFAYYLSQLSPDKIPNLRQVIFEYPANYPFYPHGGATPALHFLLNAPQQLEYISVSSLLWLGGDKAEGITRHGKTLKRLAIHNPEPGTDDPRWGLSALARRLRVSTWGARNTAVRDFLENNEWNCDGGFVNHTTLEIFRDSLPMLEELEIDMDRGGTGRDEWPWSMLSILATFPRLRKVKIWFELGACLFKDGNEDNQEDATLPRPVLTWGAAADMFRYLRQRKKKAGDAVVGIERLEVCTGAGATHGHENKFILEDWTGTEDHRAYSAAKNSTSFVCELALWHERGFTVRCPRLNNEENRKLEQAARTGRNVETDNLDFQVAFRGPISLQGWRRKDFQSWLKKSEKGKTKKTR